VQKWNGSAYIHGGHQAFRLVSMAASVYARGRPPGAAGAKIAGLPVRTLRMSTGIPCRVLLSELSRTILAFCSAGLDRSPKRFPAGPNLAEENGIAPHLIWWRMIFGERLDEAGSWINGRRQTLRVEDPIRIPAISRSICGRLRRGAADYPGTLHLRRSPHPETEPPASFFPRAGILLHQSHLVDGQQIIGV
jgi:hypothetical protein